MINYNICFDKREKKFVTIFCEKITVKEKWKPMKFFLEFGFFLSYTKNYDLAQPTGSRKELQSKTDSMRVPEPYSQSIRPDGIEIFKRRA